MPLLGEENKPKKSLFQKVRPLFGKKLTKDDLMKKNAEVLKKERENSAKSRKNEVSYKSFDEDPGRAMAWGERQFGSWQKTCDKEVIARYSAPTGEFMVLNTELRNGNEKGMSQELKDFSNQLDKTLRQARIPENIIVRRGIAFDDVLAKYLGHSKEKGDVDRYIQENLKVGSTLNEAGFLSTTVNKDVANNYTNQFQLKIMVPKDMPGAFIESISGSSGKTTATTGEYEMLFPKGTTLKVTKVDQFPDNKIVIECTMQK